MDVFLDAIIISLRSFLGFFLDNSHCIPPSKQPCAMIFCLCKAGRCFAVLTTSHCLPGCDADAHEVFEFLDDTKYVDVRAVWCGVICVQYWLSPSLPGSWSSGGCGYECVIIAPHKPVRFSLSQADGYVAAEDIPAPSEVRDHTYIHRLLCLTILF